MPTHWDFRQAEHLPNLRPGKEPASPDELPRQRNGVTPQMHGRYPDYNVLDEMGHWDEVTRRVILDRVENVPPIRFFTHPEALTLGAFCDVVMAQDREPKIPVLNMVDAKLFAKGLDAVARQHGCGDFAAASPEVQERIVDAFHSGELRGEVWDELDPKRAWSVLMRAVLSAFYSHPWSWNEIGFGGPAYPRGYARLGRGQRESWEGAPAFERDPVKDTHERGVEGAE